MIRSSARALNPPFIALAVAACVTLFPATIRADITVSGQIAVSRSFNGVFDPLDVLAAYQQTVAGSQQVGASIFQPANTFNPISIQGEVISGGGPGFVSSSSFLQRIRSQSGARGRNVRLLADAVAVSRWTDFVVSGPSGGPAMVPISANVLVEGTASLTESNIGNGTPGDPSGYGWGRGTTATFNVRINGQFSDTSLWSLSSSDGGPLTIIRSTGLFTNFLGSARGTTPTVMVPVNTPFSVEMTLSTSAVVYSSEGTGGLIAAFIDFGHTGSFDATGSAFVLPAGYTINSASAGVIANAYVVPTPGAAAVLALGGVLATRRRRGAR